MEKLENKVDKLDERLDGISIVLERNTASLEEHMKRSDMLETYVKKIEENELRPVKLHVNQVTWAIKGILWFCATVGSILVTLHEFKII